jgi:hypothetical protein
MNDDLTPDPDLEAASGHPGVDAIRTAMTPDRPGRPLSPGARDIAEISAAIDRAREMPITEHAGAPGEFIVSNCGRGILPNRRWTLEMLEEQTRNDTFLGAYKDAIAQGHSVDEATALGQGARDELAERCTLYNEVIELADYGGSPITTFILYSPRDQGVVEYTVPEGWTRRRTAMYVCRKVKDCLFCPHYGAKPDVDVWLLVDCGAVTRAFPACDDCHRRLQGPEWEDADLLSFHHAWDPWFFKVGCPDDVYI